MRKMKQTMSMFLMSSVLFAAGVRAEVPEIGAKAPDFTLIDTNGKPHSLSEYRGKTVVLEWTNFSCPFVRKHYDSGNMQALQKKWTDKGVVWLSINSSAKGKEGNVTPAEWNKAIASEKAAPTAFLIDENGTTGKSYDAKTTPHMFVIDASGNLVYKGAIDDKRSTKVADIKGAKNYVDAALTEITSGKKVSTPITQSYGCSVKY